jgi:7,8-dihydropterin-6-yl-methyl-4-(beta-D-ribofuranosyl)aminobenzene 5'-phosphate synthase
LINTLEHARSQISARPPQAAIGGFHIFAASDKVLIWTSERLAAMGLGHFLGSHCTGFESVYRIRELAGMNSTTAKIGAVGTRYEPGRGIVPGAINR